MENFEQKALDYFGALTINKSFARKAGFGSRAIPVYVREWIVSHYVKDAPDLEEDARQKIADFVHKYAPDKSEREAIKNQLFEMQDVKILDDYSVQVNLAKGDRYLIIPFLDETKGGIPPHIVRDNEMLLTSGIWGVATLSYSPPSDDSIGQTIMREFLPFQLSSLDLNYFIDSRQKFTTSEWIDFIVNSMGFNHHIYSERQKILLISRMLPMVESRYNLIELAPKGTGKSFVFENLSRYIAVRSGAISAPVLFYNDARKVPGLITRYDCVVIDEAQKVRGDSSGELTALLKSYLESGRFGRGSAGSITSEAGLVMLANIELDENHHPSNENIGLLRAFPNFLRETAFIDRFSGLLPGWNLPRVTKDTPSSAIALKGDIFGEILHMIRNDISYRDYVKTNMDIQNCDDMRDSRAVEAGASGFLKILFPDKQPSEQDFYKYCVNPAIELRQRVRDELCKLDREYIPVTFKSKFPDDFQRNHRQVYFSVPENIEQFAQIASKIVSEPIHPEDKEEAELLAFFGETEKTVEIESTLESKTIQIKEGDTGYSYENLFGPYLNGARKIYVTDPYVRLDYQIRNFMAFAGILDTNLGEITLHLTTSASEDAYQQDADRKLNELAASLAKHGIVFTYEFNPSIHDRSIRLDNGWNIYPGRGLDIFQKPDSKYELSEIDQTKRACRETQIIFQSAKA
jgi:ATP-dependent Lon protease